MGVGALAGFGVLGDVSFFLGSDVGAGLLEHGTGMSLGGLGDVWVGEGGAIPAEDAVVMLLGGGGVVDRLIECGEGSFGLGLFRQRIAWAWVGLVGPRSVRLTARHIHIYIEREKEAYLEGYSGNVR